MRTIVRLTALAAVLALSGCGNLPVNWRAHDAVAVPAPGPFEPADRYDLPAPGDEVVGRIQVVTARHEDTLPDLARRYDLGYDEITVANPGVDPWLPGEGTTVLLPTRFILPAAPREGIVINVAARRLFYFPADEPGVVITHPIGIGREEWATPLGATTVKDKVVDPAWYPPASIRKEHAEQGDPLPAIVPPGPDNPLGSRALLLDLPGYLIHGTNKPYGVGMRVSHGCIRLYPEDISPLFDRVPRGTPVRIVNQPLLAGWQGDELYLQAYPKLAEDDRELEATLKEAVTDALARRNDEAVAAAVDWERADVLARSSPVIPVGMKRGGPDLDTLVAAARVVVVEASASDEAASAESAAPTP